VSAWIYSFEVGEFDSAGNFSMVKLGVGLFVVFLPLNRLMDDMLLLFTLVQYSKSILTQYFTSVYWALTTMVAG